MTSQAQTKQTQEDINQARKWALEQDKQMLNIRIETLRKEAEYLAKQIADLDKPTALKN